MNHDHYREFDIAYAISGRNIGCRQKGLKPEIFKRTATHVYGLIHHTNTAYRPSLQEWAISGSAYSDAAAGSYDLVLLPIGEVSGRPVFVGDILFDKYGGQLLVGSHIAENPDLLDGCTWKMAWKIETRITVEEFKKLTENAYSAPEEWRIVANEVMARAIKDGDVSPCEPRP